jgi:hypothetical protein
VDFGVAGQAVLFAGHESLRGPIFLCAYVERKVP